MLRIRAPLICSLGLLGVTLLGMAQPHSEQAANAGPDPILYMNADSVVFLRSLDWLSANTRNQEKLLTRTIRMEYWRAGLQPDMAMVFDTLGYPSGRVILTPVGHNEEWWYYGQLGPPLRFRDGALLDQDRFEALTSHL